MSPPGVERISLTVSLQALWIALSVDEGATSCTLHLFPISQASCDEDPTACSLVFEAADCADQDKVGFFLPLCRCQFWGRISHICVVRVVGFFGRGIRGRCF